MTLKDICSIAHVYYLRTYQQTVVGEYTNRNIYSATAVTPLSLMQPPNAKAVSGDVFPLVLLYIPYKYVHYKLITARYV